MRDLENFGVCEMDAKEVNDTNGGIFGLDDLLVGIAVAVVVEVIGDWDEFKRGLGVS